MYQMLHPMYQCIKSLPSSRIDVIDSIDPTQAKSLLNMSSELLRDRRKLYNSAVLKEARGPASKGGLWE